MVVPPTGTKISAVSMAKLRRAGANAAAVNRARLFKMPENNETRLISNR